MTYKKVWQSSLLFLITTTFVLGQTKPNQIVQKIQEAATAQYTNAVNSYKDSARYPRSTRPNGSLYSVDCRDWCSGFFPGSLWLIYNLTNDAFYEKAARKWSIALEKEQFDKSTHDLGFMMYNSFGNGYRLTKDENYKRIILQSANSLATRFNAKASVIRSWDFGPWQFPVIIDNMMNLEMLVEVSKLSGNKRYKEIAILHANHDMQHHFRKDYSSYHVVDYDTTNGNPIKKQTNQGYNDESAWARGQAWGLYGFTTMYRYTKDKKYLDHAEHIAEFILTNPNYPKDGIPYWDFNDPKIPDTYRDASAAAIIASALLELKNFVNKEKSSQYFKQAELILSNLSTPTYLATQGNGNFILQHCVGNWPKGKATGEIDAAINYGDYYLLEAALRYQEVTKHRK